MMSTQMTRANVLFVGNPGSGKSELVNSLQNNEVIAFAPEQNQPVARTHVRYFEKKTNSQTFGLYDLNSQIGFNNSLWTLTPIHVLVMTVDVNDLPKNNDLFLEELEMKKQKLKNNFGVEPIVCVAFTKIDQINSLDGCAENQLNQLKADIATAEHDYTIIMCSAQNQEGISNFFKEILPKLPAVFEAKQVVDQKAQAEEKPGFFMSSVHANMESLGAFFLYGVISDVGMLVGSTMIDHIKSMMTNIKTAWQAMGHYLTLPSLRTVVSATVGELGVVGAAGLFAGMFMLTGATLGFGMMFILGGTAVGLSLYFSKTIPATAPAVENPAPSVEQASYLQGLIDPVMNIQANVNAAANRTRTFVEIAGASVFAVTFLLLGATLGFYLTVGIELFVVTNAVVGYVNHKRQPEAVACVYGAGSRAVICQSLDKEQQKLDKKPQDVQQQTQILTSKHAAVVADKVIASNGLNGSHGYLHFASSAKMSPADGDDELFDVDFGTPRSLSPSPFDI